VHETREAWNRLIVAIAVVAGIACVGSPCRLVAAQSQPADSAKPQETTATDPAATPAEESADEKPETFSEEIVVTGTRGEARSVAEAPVPIDVISKDDFVNQGDTDLVNLVRTMVPSYQANTQPISDAATVVRPATLRNLAPDHTLVLINGKRQHRAAVIYWIGNGVADGAQGPDISTIPAIALRQVEVLRDGASAQYGSDAIAGVMNFLLRDDTSGGTVEVRSGQYQEGDGTASTITGNFGFPLGEHGFSNFSFEYGQADPTSRSVQRNDAAALIAAGNTLVQDPAQVWGSPEVDDDLKLFGNFGRVLAGGSQLFAHANYASKTVTGGFYFRNPNTRAAVYSADDGETLLIGDMLDAQDGVLDGSAHCPIVRIVNDVPDPVALAAVKANPNCFSFQELFPGGFTPSFGGEVKDYSLVGGIRGQTAGGLSWEASVTSGFNEVHFFIDNTVNASLGPATPTSFDPGAYTQEELGVNFDVGYSFSPEIHLAAGAEYRDEQFQIDPGQLESYVIGPLAAQGFSSASNGFPGFGTLAAGKWDRSNYAVYGDLEYDRTKWMIDVAARFEDFEDFGSTTNGKLAGRYSFSDSFSMRGSVSTGFRAPTPGQSNAFNVTTQFDLTRRELVNQGTIPPGSRVAQLRGGRPLKPEKSTNYAVGSVFDKGPFALTIDLFRVDLEDRLAVTRDFELTPAEVQLLLAEGITSAANLQSFRFFTNDFETETSGVDVVATFAPPALGGKGRFTLLMNHTETDVTRFNPETLSAARVRQLQEALPENRATLSYEQQFGDHWRALARSSFYDKWFDNEDGQVYGGETILDLELAYSFDFGTTVVVGGTNVLNQYPEENPFAADGVGNRYSQYTPFGFNGAFWYARVKHSFSGLGKN
jgi:iron complex outermembrane receptor protein